MASGVLSRNRRNEATNSPRRATGGPSQSGSDDYSVSAIGADVDPSIVKSKWDVIKRVQIRERREFWINQAFLLDEQYIRYDKFRDTVARVEFRDPDRLRLTVNRLRPNLNTLMAKLTSRPLRWDVLPDAPDDALVLGARLAEEVLSSTHDKQRWEHLRRYGLQSMYLGGTNGCCVEWDTSAGVDLGVQTELGRQVATGDVRLTSLNITEFGLQPGVRNVDEATWWVRALAVPPTQVRDTYDLDWLPEPDASSEQTLVLLYDSSWRPFADRSLVLTYFERPTRKNPQGLVGTVCNGEWIDGPYDWPFPFKDRLNLAVFRQTQVIGRWSGDTVLASVRPIQIAYNLAKSNIAEHMKKAGNARLAVPAGSSSMFDALTDEPGEIFEYNQQLGKAEYLSPPNLPQWMLDHIHDLEANIDQIMGVSNAMQSGQASSTEMGMSGIAMAQQSEKADTPLGWVAWEMAQGWSEVGSMVLECYASLAKEKRKAVTAGPAGSSVMREWNGKALQGQCNAKVPVDLILPHSRVAQQAFAKEMMDASGGSMSLTTFAQIADLPNSEQLVEAVDADVAKTQRKMHEIAMGRNPVPELWDDHGKAIAEANRFRKSATYERLPDDRKQIVGDWVKAHEAMQAHQIAGQHQLAAVHPDLAAAPQADEPPGSGVPVDAVEAQALARGAVPGPPSQPIQGGGEPMPAGQSVVPSGQASPPGGM